MGKVMEIEEISFQDKVLNSDKPVLVDFWAPWCAPCRMLAPVLEEIGEEMSDKVKIMKLNVDNNQSIAANYGIMGIPTMILFNKGQEVDRLIGMYPKEHIVSWLESRIRSSSNS